MKPVLLWYLVYDRLSPIYNYITDDSKPNKFHCMSTIKKSIY